MDFELTEQQRLLQATVRERCDARLTLEPVVWDQPSR